MAVVTISRQFGSGGDEIASKVCDVLHYRLFNKSMVEEAAREAGFSDQEMVDLSEDNYKVRSFFDRLFARMATAQLMGFGMTDDMVMSPSEWLPLTEEASLDLVKKSVLRACQAGSMVIVGRGGQVLLKEHPSVLHVRVIAPLEDRILKVREELRRSQEAFFANIDPRREAQDLILRKDDASAEYLKNFYHVSWDDPLLYHLVINTGRVEIDEAVHLITEMVHCHSGA